MAKKTYSSVIHYIEIALFGIETISISFMIKNINFRRIPDYINRELNGINSPFVVVSTTLKVSLVDITRGKYHNLGITIRDGHVSFNPNIVPHAANGTYSKRNRYGYDIVYKDRPKVRKTYYWETPNFGDPSKGYHDNSRTVMAYQRKFIAPREWSLSIELLKQVGELVMVKVAVDTS